MAVYDSPQCLSLGLPQAPARGRGSDGTYAATLKSQPEQNSHLQFEECRVALGQLPIDQCEALVLVGASGFSYEQAAEI